MVCCWAKGIVRSRSINSGCATQHRTRGGLPMLSASLRTIKYSGAIVGCAAVVVGAVHVAKSAAQSTSAGVSNASPIFGITIPPGYRDWKLIAVDELKTDKVDQLRAQLGNEIAIKAFKEG